MDYILQNPGLNLIGTAMFSYLDLQSLLNCQLVSKKWKNFIDNDKVLWKQQVRNCSFQNNDCQPILRFLKNRMYPQWFGNELEKMIEKVERSKTIQRCLTGLMHAVSCTDTNCGLSSCGKMKKVVKHTLTCNTKIFGGCQICKQLIALCVFHSKNCQDKNCVAHFCKAIKGKMKEAEQK